MESQKQREGFGSRLGFILVSAGCAIGIGNVWRFPTVTGQCGGGIFGAGSRPGGPRRSTRRVQDAGAEGQ